MSKLFQKYLCAGPTEYMADLFSQMTNDTNNGMQLALEFYSLYGVFLGVKFVFIIKLCRFVRYVDALNVL